MSDFQDQNETPYYELSTPGIIEKQNNPTSYQSSIQVNQQTNNNGRNANYRSPCDVETSIIIFFFFLCGIFAAIGMISAGISENIITFILLSLIPLLFSIIAFIIGRIITIYTVIDISSTLGTIVITKKKIFCCFNKKQIVQINDIQKIVIQSEFSSFYIIFKLSDGREIYGCSRINNQNGEGKKAF